MKTDLGAGSVGYTGPSKGLSVKLVLLVNSRDPCCRDHKGHSVLHYSEHNYTQKFQILTAHSIINWRTKVNNPKFIKLNMFYPAGNIVAHVIVLWSELIFEFFS